MARKQYFIRLVRGFIVRNRPDGKRSRVIVALGSVRSLRLRISIRLVTNCSNDVRIIPPSLPADFTTLSSPDLSEADRLWYNMGRWNRSTLSMKVVKHTLIVLGWNCIDLIFLIRYNLLRAFFTTDWVFSLYASFESRIVPRYLYEETRSTFSLLISSRGDWLYFYCWSRSSPSFCWCWWLTYY